MCARLRSIQNATKTSVSLHPSTRSEHFAHEALILPRVDGVVPLRLIEPPRNHVRVRHSEGHRGVATCLSEILRGTHRCATQASTAKLNLDLDVEDVEVIGRIGGPDLQITGSVAINDHFEYGVSVPESAVREEYAGALADELGDLIIRQAG